MNDFDEWIDKELNSIQIIKTILIEDSEQN